MANLKHTLAGIALAFTVAIGGTAALADAELFAELEQEAQISRELELKEPLNVSMMTREEYTAQSQLELVDELPTDGAADWQQVLVFLGYIEPGDDIMQIYADLMSGQVLGYYDPETKKLVIISTGDDEWNVTDKSTFVHETTHAIQDQHFDLLSIWGPEDAVLTDDSYLSTLSLIEGDATLSEMIYLVRNDLIDQIIEEQADMDFGGLDEAPVFLQETTLFPYIEGADFVTFLWQDGGWEAVNDAWENPPTTTEQILHPEKYVDGEGAIPVAIADPTEAMPDWRVLEYNENGELGMKVFLINGGASQRQASAAAKGWGGDADYIITNDDETAIVWVSTWDTEDDADEYLETLIEVESERLAGTFEEVDEGTLRLTADGWYAEIHHDGADISYYIAQSAETLDQVVASQENATIAPEASPQATPEVEKSTPVAAVSFWVRER